MRLIKTDCFHYSFPTAEVMMNSVKAAGLPMKILMKGSFVSMLEVSDTVKVLEVLPPPTL